MGFPGRNGPFCLRSCFFWLICNASSGVFVSSDFCIFLQPLLLLLCAQWAANTCVLIDWQRQGGVGGPSEEFPPSRPANRRPSISTFPPGWSFSVWQRHQVTEGHRELSEPYHRCHTCPELSEIAELNDSRHDDASVPFYGAPCCPEGQTSWYELLTAIGSDEQFNYLGQMSKDFIMS